MLYTFLGTAVGILVTYVYCEISKVSHSKKPYSLSTPELILTLGVVIGGGIGYVIDIN